MLDGRQVQAVLVVGRRITPLPALRHLVKVLLAVILHKPQIMALAEAVAQER
jgi:hypothetical protein